MINVAKWVLLALLALPFLELAVFVVVSAMIGFGWALSLVAAGSAIGLLILRRAGGNHIARMRVALDQGSFTAWQADASGGAILTAGILLLIPGFITDIAALCLLIPPLRHAMFGHVVAADRNDGVVDLPPEQWHQVPDPSLPDQRRHEPKR